MLLGTLCIVACQKDPYQDFEGEEVNVSGINTFASTLYVLSEGVMGTNSATLDALSFAGGTFRTNVFGMANDYEPLGDVGNDIAVHGNEVWMVINNSGIVEVISTDDGREIAAIQVPTPRNIAFDDHYAYVTSWAGAYAEYSYDENWNAVLGNYLNPKGCVYRINLSTKKIEGSPLEVGYQPEGIACSGGKLYVANSGGISSQLPPSYSYDKTVSVIDAPSFTVSKTIDVSVNLKNVYASGDGRIYVTSLGNYYDVHSALWMIDKDGSVKHIEDYVSVSAIYGNTVYCYGTEQEFDWYAASKTYKSWACKSGVKVDWDFKPQATTPYGLFALNNEVFFLGDAYDYYGPGTVSCYKNGSQLWSVVSGVCPGHFAVK